MAKNTADLSDFQVNRTHTPEPKTKHDNKKLSKDDKPELVLKGFHITPEAARQFDILKAEIGDGRYKGTELIAEALNLLFKKYKKPELA